MKFFSKCIYLFGLISYSATALSQCELGCLVRVNYYKDMHLVDSVELTLNDTGSVSKTVETVLPILVSKDDEGNEDRHDIVVDSLSADIQILSSGSIQFFVDFQTVAKPVNVVVNGETFDVEGVTYHSFSVVKRSMQGILAEDKTKDATYKFTYSVEEISNPNI